MHVTYTGVFRIVIVTQIHKRLSVIHMTHTEILE